MKIIVTLLWCCVFSNILSAMDNKAPKTMRLDYFHSGNATTEYFSLDELVEEPLTWSGNLNKSIDTLQRGKYLFEVSIKEVDSASTVKADSKAKTGNNSNKEVTSVIYSRSFSSIYGEWETTDEATKLSRSFHESVRFPKPDKPFTLTIKKRDAQNVFQNLWSIQLDPDDYLNPRETAAYQQQVVAINTSGNPQDKVDLLILGDGYTLAEQAKFIEKARQLSENFLSSYPFDQHRQDFNIWALAPAALESGVSRPSTGVYRNSPLGASYDAFRSERYVLTFDNKSWRRVASSAHYDTVIIITNSDTYGGGGIYGLYSTAAANSDWADYLFVHEFGHHFAGLADEYYTSSVAYQPGQKITEPYEPNVTALLEPKKLKWRHLLSENTQVPTAWPKQEFEKHSMAYQKLRNELRAQDRPEKEMNQLFRDNQLIVEQLFLAHENQQKVGAFQGANYHAQQYFRSSMNCIMFTRTKNFCTVCSDAIEQMIKQYTRD